MGYNQKIEIELNDLQKRFFRLFRKSFSELVSRIEIEKGIIQPTNFCFSVKSNSDEFGKLYFDIDDREVTVSTRFDHSHFNIDLYDNEIDKLRQIQLTSLTVFYYVREFVDSNVIIEYQALNNRVIRAREYYKDDSMLFSSTVDLSIERNTVNWKSKVKKFFQKRKDESLITKRVNWFGEIE